MDLLKSRRINSLLGIAFDGNRIAVSHLKRNNGNVTVAGRFSATLSLNPLSHEPELVGQELRQQMASAGLKEKRCVVAVPQSWALTMQTQIPEIPVEDVREFLSMEAERGFGSGTDTISLGTSRFQVSDKEAFATIVGIPTAHLERLAAALRAARLDPIGFTLGTPVVHSMVGTGGTASVSLVVGESTITLQIGTPEGIAALRSLDSVVEGDGSNKQIDVSVLMRELRVTLAQLPAGIRNGLKTLRLFGEGAMVEKLAADLVQPLKGFGLILERVADIPKSAGTLSAPAKAVPEILLPLRHLASNHFQLEFLPPQVSAWQQLTSRYSSKGVAYALGCLAVLILWVAGMFAYQQRQLSVLRSQWGRLSANVRELEGIQQDIKQYRPWFDDSVRHLSILKRLTEVFPEDGTITAKNIEVRDGFLVTCTGTTKDAEVLYKMLDRLRGTQNVSEVTVDQLRGEASRQFSFNFHWGEKTQP